jgi:uncharacterized protein YggE
MLRRKMRVAMIAGLMVAAAQIAVGECPKETLWANGSAVIPLRPDAVRMVLRIQTQDKTLKAALTKLRQQREAAIKKLEGLKPGKDTIKFVGPAVCGDGPMRTFPTATVTYKTPLATPPTWTPLPAPAPGSVQAAVPGGEVPAGPPPAVVYGTISAEWPLAGDNVEKQLLDVQELKKKIEAADLLGVKKAKRGDADDGSEEGTDDAAPSTYAPSVPPILPSPTMIIGGSVVPYSPGVPTFVYVAHTSPTQRKAAMREACDKAKVRAAELAEAIGAHLGPVWDVRLLSGPSYFSWSDDAPSADSDSGRNEVTGANPNALRTVVTVDVGFRLTP